MNRSDNRNSSNQAACSRSRINAVPIKRTKKKALSFESKTRIPWQFVISLLPSRQSRLVRTFLPHNPSTLCKRRITPHDKLPSFPRLDLFAHDPNQLHNYSCRIIYSLKLRGHVFLEFFFSLHSGGIKVCLNYLLAKKGIFLDIDFRVFRKNGQYKFLSIDTRI